MKIDGNISIFLAHVLLKSLFYNVVWCKFLLFLMQIDTEIAIFLVHVMLQFVLVKISTLNLESYGIIQPRRKNVNVFQEL